MMGKHEASGKTDDWYTPDYVFAAMCAAFDLDVASPDDVSKIPAGAWCEKHISANSLKTMWQGFIWMNPPFGGRNGYLPWAQKFVERGNGVALAPNRTGAPWCSWFLTNCDRALFVSPKIKFLRPDGTLGKSPGYGSILLSIGERGNRALHTAAANGLGVLFERLGRNAQTKLARAA